MITETDEAASAIDALIAAKGGAMSRSEALRVILQEGIRALDPARIQLRTQRLNALAAIKSDKTFSGVWPANWKEELLSEWPD